MLDYLKDVAYALRERPLFLLVLAFTVVLVPGLLRLSAMLEAL